MFVQLYRTTYLRVDRSYFTFPTPPAGADKARSGLAVPLAGLVSCSSLNQRLPMRHTSPSKVGTENTKGSVL